MKGGRRFLAVFYLLDGVLACVVFSIGMKYGPPNLFTFPLALLAGGWLSRGSPIRRRILMAVAWTLTLFLTLTGGYVFLVERSSPTALRLLTLHYLLGPPLVFLILPPVTGHLMGAIPRARPRDQMWGQISLMVLRLALWPAAYVGALAIGPAWLRHLHLLFIFPAVAMVLIHRNLGRKGAARPPVFGRRWIEPAIAFSLAGPAFAVVYGISEATPPQWADASTESVSGQAAEFTPSPISTSDGMFHSVHQVGRSDSCGQEGCHPNIHAQWDSSPHRHSTNIFYRETLVRMTERHGKDLARFCAGCHDPITLLTGRYDGDFTELFPEETSSEGLSCIVCHASEADGEIGNGGYRFIPPRFFIGEPLNPYTVHTFRDDHRADFAPEDGYREPALCGECHNLTLPGSLSATGKDHVEQSTYSEWFEGPYHNTSHAGFETEKTCIDCHMPRNEEPDRPGRKEASHRFAASNSHLPFLRGDLEQLDHVKSFLSSSIIDASAVCTMRNGMIEIALRLRNRGVGHDFPSGVLDLNEAWLHIHVKDGTNRVVFERGVVSESGEVDPRAIFFREIPLDANGNAITDHDLLRATGAAEKNTLPSGGVRIIPFAFSVPPNSRPPYRLSADLFYRKLNPRFASRIIPTDQAVKLPIIRMASTAAPCAPSPAP